MNYFKPTSTGEDRGAVGANDGSRKNRGEITATTCASVQFFYIAKNTGFASALLAPSECVR